VGYYYGIACKVINESDLEKYKAVKEKFKSKLDNVGMTFGIQNGVRYSTTIPKTLGDEMIVAMKNTGLTCWIRY